MIATQILIFTVVFISSVHFITCPAAVLNGSEMKPSIKKIDVVEDKPTDLAVVKGELNKSNLVKTSVPTKINHLVSKSIGLFFWPFRKSWKVIKNLMPLHQNIIAKQQPTRNEINIQ